MKKFYFVHRHLKLSLLVAFVVLSLVACVAHKQIIMRVDVQSYQDGIDAIKAGVGVYEKNKFIESIEISLSCSREVDALDIYQKYVFTDYNVTLKHPSKKVWLIEYVKELPFDAYKLMEESGRFLPVVEKYTYCDGPFVGVGLRRKEE